MQWPSLIRTLKELEAAGLIERRINSADKRSRQVTLTEKGLAVFREVKAVLDPTRAALLESFSTKELPGHRAPAQPLLRGDRLAQFRRRLVATHPDGRELRGGFLRQPRRLAEHIAADILDLLCAEPRGEADHAVVR